MDSRRGDDVVCLARRERLLGGSFCHSQSRMARRHRWPHFKDQLLAAWIAQARFAKLWPEPAAGYCRQRCMLYLEIFLRNSSGQRFDSIQQVFLARDSRDLIAQLAVLEKKQSRNRANVVLG